MLGYQNKPQGKASSMIKNSSLTYILLVFQKPNSVKKKINCPKYLMGVKVIQDKFLIPKK